MSARDLFGVGFVYLLIGADELWASALGLGLCAAGGAVLWKVCRAQPGAGRG